MEMRCGTAANGRLLSIVASNTRPNLDGPVMLLRSALNGKVSAVPAKPERQLGRL